MKKSKNSIKNCVHQLKVLADETRMMIIQEIIEESKTVSQINQKILVEQSLLSHHLKILRDAGLVFSERNGKSVLYQTSPEILSNSQAQTINLGCCSLNFPKKNKDLSK